MLAYSLITLERDIRAWKNHLLRINPLRQTIALYAENSAHWLAIDIACQRAAIDLIPIPTFFSNDQLQRLISQHPFYGTLVTDELADRLPFQVESSQSCPILGWQFIRHEQIPNNGSGSGCKVTFTSGSTADPKPIVLSAKSQRQTAAALFKLREHLRLHRHLCMLPLSLLLENVAGAYSCLLSGGEVIAPNTSETGLTGSSHFDAERAWHLIRESSANSIILLPQMLKELINQASNSKPLTDLRFIAVGGARVTPETIAAARAVGLPAYQGYGLSEAGSVVSLNMPHSDRICSVGRPLEHVKIRIAEDGEIIVQQISGRLTPGSIDVPTGDLGRIDADGFLYVEGRKKNQIITGFGRNVSPEWPESLLEDQEPIAQALVFEDDQSAVAALLVPVNVDISDEQLQSAVDRVNHGLPDYARISGWQRFEAGFTKFNGLATPNGRPRRAAILQQLREGTYS